MHDSQQVGRLLLPGTLFGFFRQPLSVEVESFLFVVASALDAAITVMLLDTGEFTESNPIAMFFFLRWGHHGMVYFKFAMVAFVCVIAQIIAFKKVDTARRLMIFATTIVLMVVLYSVMLFQFVKNLPYE